MENWGWQESEVHVWVGSLAIQYWELYSIVNEKSSTVADLRDRIQFLEQVLLLSKT